jgi:Nuclease-related domain
MILKPADSKADILTALERAIAAAPADRKKRIEQELRTVRAGMKGEEQAAYLIDFHFKDRENWVVIHDLRLEINERVAQIDHLLLHRCLDCYVLETKHFSSGFKITEDGEFLRWNHYRKTFEGMASPLAQNDQHVAVLRDAFDHIEMPTRLGVRLSPTFYPLVLVSAEARIDRPREFDSSGIIKVDALRNTINRQVEKAGVLDVLGGLARLVSVETLQEIGKQLVALHKPATFDVVARFGVTEPESLQREDMPTEKVAGSAASSEDPQGEKASCRACGSEEVAIQYGKYGYYFKCANCNGNTPIRLGCRHAGHRERLHKDARRFYRECAECKSSSLYFVNPA